MSPSFLEQLASYWAQPEIAVNLVIIFNLAGALLLGLIVGYERSYHGRAAGMRTYGMVCMASAALTVLCGYPEYWYGAHFATGSGTDPTRVIQGIVTGIGFLGAGLIMKDGMSISGLTTAASIWSSSAIGVLVGVGFYAAAILLTLISAALMMWGAKVEARLPSKPAIAIVLRFVAGYEKPSAEVLRQIARDRGYVIAASSFVISYEQQQLEWRFVAVAIDGHKSARITDMADELSRFEGVSKFQMSHARN
ncbi:MgtC/SapB family protein [Aquipseudomonas campi]|uniref:Protein MgtC n=1 Tax=Aquipseudomonas campi TaxID=2731681 RepID=A0A6M8FTV7_9GAMM|nr:MgtC/SapB family protein [Pseudomonas campi]QKE63436.1 MgtC/SapB family protein [Pseudomonas campi]